MSRRERRSEMGRKKYLEMLRRRQVHLVLYAGRAWCGKNLHFGYGVSDVNRVDCPWCLVNFFRHVRAAVVSGRAAR